MSSTPDPGKEQESKPTAQANLSTAQPYPIWLKATLAGLAFFQIVTLALVLENNRLLWQHIGISAPDVLRTLAEVIK